MIAGKKKNRFPGAQVANSEGEHSIQALDAIRTFFLIEMNNDLRVGIRFERVALALQLGPKFRKVVDFAVVGHPHGTIFV